MITLRDCLIASLALESNYLNVLLRGRRCFSFTLLGGFTLCGPPACLRVLNDALTVALPVTLPALKLASLLDLPGFTALGVAIISIHHGLIEYTVAHILSSFFHVFI